MFPQGNGLCERKEFHETVPILRRKITNLQSGCTRVAFPLEGVCQDRIIFPPYDQFLAFSRSNQSIRQSFSRGEGFRINLLQAYRETLKKLEWV
jgi:hypothetical protein